MEAHDNGEQEDREEGGEDMELDAAGHADGNGGEDEDQIAGVLEGRAEAHDRHGADQREGAGDIGADDHHDQGDRDADQDNRLQKRFGV